MRVRALFVAATLAACNGKPADDTDDTTDTDAATCAYKGPDDAAPGALQVGYGRRRIPAPVGIGTAGNGPFGAPSSPSPFADIYPGTKNVHGHPEIKVMALSRGPGHEAIFVRLDAIGMFSQFRTEVVKRASELVGRDLDHAILVGATHTHSGPGRVVNTGSEDGGFFDIIADKFNAEFYERFVEAIAGAIADAVADLGPGRLGTSTAVCDDGHADRRCEDGLIYENGTAPLLVVEKDGEIRTVLLAYAIHGTVSGIGELYLTQDASGGIEEAIEDRFDHPVDAIMFNAWGADMSPGSPADVPLDVTAANVPSNFRRERSVGWTVANAVEAKLATLTWDSEPDIDLQVHRVSINRDLIGYEADQFDYPYGAVYCGNSSGTCPPTTYDWSLAAGCVPFNEAFPAPSQTDITVGKIGPFAVLTWPGESGTLLAEKLIADIKADNPDVGDVLYLGYTQDYLGYSILEDDWFHGGYEASGALWGPRQGEYLSSEIRRVYNQYRAGTCPAPEPARLEPFPYTITAPYQLETALTPNTVLSDVDDEVGVSDTIELIIAGQDPWAGTPLARLEYADGSPVLRANGVAVDSDDYNFDVNMSETPVYAKSDSKIVRESRTFAWRFRIPVRQPVLGGLALDPGDYKLIVSVPQPTGAPVDVSSATFTVLSPPGL